MKQVLHFPASISVFPEAFQKYSSSNTLTFTKIAQKQEIPNHESKGTDIKGKQSIKGLIENTKLKMKDMPRLEFKIMNTSLQFQEC